MNFLNETNDCIKDSGHSIEDIIFIGSSDGEYGCDWNQFESIANFEYDDGFGSQKIPTDLIIVFSDNSTMWRGEYDGAEAWEYSKLFKMPAEFKKLNSLICPEKVGWYSIKEIHEEI